MEEEELTTKGTHEHKARSASLCHQARSCCWGIRRSRRQSNTPASKRGRQQTGMNTTRNRTSSLRINGRAVHATRGHEIRTQAPHCLRSPALTTPIHGTIAKNVKIIVTPVASAWDATNQARKRRVQLAIALKQPMPRPRAIDASLLLAVFGGCIAACKLCTAVGPLSQITVKSAQHDSGEIVTGILTFVLLGALRG